MSRETAGMCWDSGWQDLTRSLAQVSVLWGTLCRFYSCFSEQKPLKKTDSGCRIWNGMVVSHRENLSLLPNTHARAHTHTGPPRWSVNYSQHHTLREVVDPEPGCRLGISWLPAYQQQDWGFLIFFSLFFFFFFFFFVLILNQPATC